MSVFTTFFWYAIQQWLIDRSAYARIIDDAWIEICAPLIQGCATLPLFR